MRTAGLWSPWVSPNSTKVIVFAEGCFLAVFKSSANKLVFRSLNEWSALLGSAEPQLLSWDQFINSFTADTALIFEPGLHLHAIAFPSSSQDLLLLRTWINPYDFAVLGSWADRSPLHDAAFQGRLLSLKTLIAQVKAYR